MSKKSTDATLSTPVTPVDPNAKFKIGEFTNGKETKRIYMLHPGDHFVRFGGSSAGLVVKKTASMIIQSLDMAGTHDYETVIADKHNWRILFHVIRQWKEVDFE